MSKSTLVNRNDGFYQKLRKRIHIWLLEKGKSHKYADYLLLAPDLFHLLSKLVLDPRVRPTEKASLAVAIAYFISPLDLLPEAVLGPVGFLDDVALAAFVLNRIIKSGHGKIAASHWAGTEELLIVTNRVLAMADSALGSGLWNRLKGKV